MRVGDRKWVYDARHPDEKTKLFDIKEVTVVEFHPDRVKFIDDEGNTIWEDYQWFFSSKKECLEKNVEELRKARDTAYEEAQGFNDMLNQLIEQTKIDYAVEAEEWD